MWCEGLHTLDFVEVPLCLEVMSLLRSDILLAEGGLCSCWPGLKKLVVVLEETAPPPAFFFPAGTFSFASREDGGRTPFLLPALDLRFCGVVALLTAC